MRIQVTEGKYIGHDVEFNVRCKWCKKLMEQAEVVVQHAGQLYFECRECMYKGMR